jgi:sugar phosphate permease
MAPALRREFGLSLAQTGLLISMQLIGSLATLIPWGMATDRLGERLVLFAGLLGCGATLFAAGYAHTFELLAVLVGVSGAVGASVQSASGRAVMHWFPPRQRGVALAVRQTAIPISGFLASLVLPHVADVRWGFATMGIACATGATVGALVLREGPQPEPRADAGPAPLRDGRLWKLSFGSSLVIAPQLCVVGFTVLMLHERRGLATSSAAAVLAVMQLLAIGGRIGAGRWSDVLQSRLVPLRRIALAAAVLVAISGLLIGAPLALLLPFLVVGGVLSMSWNSLSFAAAVEIAGHNRSGLAIGLQQTILNLPGAAYPALFGALVAATSWRAAFLAVALFPLAGWSVLGTMRE